MEALTQTFLGIRTVKSFGGEERELARYRELNEDFLSSSMKMVLLRAVLMTNMAFMPSLLLFISLRLSSN